MANEIVNLGRLFFVDTKAVILQPVRSLRLKIASPLFIAAASAALSLAVYAQEHPSPAPANGAGEHRQFKPPTPTNLKVLPKGSTGEQVIAIMRRWEGELGAECTTCHTIDPTRKMPNGRPALNFADDSKAEKKTARLMYRMTQEINKKYLSEIAEDDHDKAGGKEKDAVSCGTCHRGNVHPPTFTPPKEEHDHEHPAPEKP